MEPMVAFSTLLPEIAPSLSGAPLATIDAIAKGVVREFFNDSGAWVVTLPVVDAVASQGEYTLTAEDPAVAQVLLVMGVEFLSSGTFRPLTPANRRFTGGLPADTGTPNIFYGHEDGLGAISLYPAPESNATGAIRPTVCLTIPDDWDKTIPASIATAWAGVLVDGVLGRAMMMQDKPWSNPSMAMYHLRRFRSGISNARNAARRQFVYIDYPIAFPRWA